MPNDLFINIKDKEERSVKSKRWIQCREFDTCPLFQHLQHLPENSWDNVPKPYSFIDNLQHKYASIEPLEKHQVGCFPC